jgi:hypothetical protein
MKKLLSSIITSLLILSIFSVQISSAAAPKKLKVIQELRIFPFVAFHPKFKEPAVLFRLPHGENAFKYFEGYVGYNENLTPIVSPYKTESNSEAIRRIIANQTYEEIGLGQEPEHSIITKEIVSVQKFTEINSELDARYVFLPVYKFVSGTQLYEAADRHGFNVSDDFAWIPLSQILSGNPITHKTQHYKYDVEIPFDFKQYWDKYAADYLQEMLKQAAPAPPGGLAIAEHKKEVEKPGAAPEVKAGAEKPIYVIPASFNPHAQEWTFLFVTAQEDIKLFKALSDANKEKGVVGFTPIKGKKEKGESIAQAIARIMKANTFNLIQPSVSEFPSIAYADGTLYFAPVKKWISGQELFEKANACN